MYWTVLLVGLAGVLVLGAAALRELPKPYPLTAKRTFVAAWAVAAGGVGWWAAVAGGRSARRHRCGAWAFSLRRLNRGPERASYPPATPHQPPR